MKDIRVRGVYASGREFVQVKRYVKKIIQHLHKDVGSRIIKSLAYFSHREFYSIKESLDYNEEFLIQRLQREQQGLANRLLI